MVDGVGDVVAEDYRMEFCLFEKRDGLGVEGGGGCVWGEGLREGAGGGGGEAGLEEGEDGGVGLEGEFAVSVWGWLGFWVLVEGLVELPSVKPFVDVHYAV